MSEHDVNPLNRLGAQALQLYTMNVYTEHSTATLHPVEMGGHTHINGLQYLDSCYSEYR